MKLWLRLFLISRRRDNGRRRRGKRPRFRERNYSFSLFFQFIYFFSREMSIDPVLQPLALVSVDAGAMLQVIFSFHVPFDD